MNKLRGCIMRVCYIYIYIKDWNIIYACNLIRLVVKGVVAKQSCKTGILYVFKVHSFKTRVHV